MLPNLFSPAIILTIIIHPLCLPFHTPLSHHPCATTHYRLQQHHTKRKHLTNSDHHCSAYSHTNTRKMTMNAFELSHTKTLNNHPHPPNRPIPTLTKTHAHKQTQCAQFQKAFNRLLGRVDTDGQRRSQSQTTGTNNTTTMLSVQQVRRCAPAPAQSDGDTSASYDDNTADQQQQIEESAAPAGADAAEIPPPSMSTHRKPSGRRSVRQLHRLMRSGSRSGAFAGDAARPNASTASSAVNCESAAIRQVAFEMTVFVDGSEKCGTGGVQDF